MLNKERISKLFGAVSSRDTFLTLEDFNFNQEQNWVEERPINENLYQRVFEGNINDSKFSTSSLDC